MASTLNTEESAGMAKRLLNFAGLPFLSMATPFLILPVLARIAGADAWVSIAVGQSVGGFFALIVAQGYNLAGPTMVNLIPASARAAAFCLSVQSRVVVFLPLSAASFLVAWMLAPESYRLECGLMSVAISTTGLSSAWFMIGLGRPGLIAIYEILPKVIATFIAMIVIVVYVQIIWYPILLIASSLCSLALFAKRTTTFSALIHFRIPDVQEALRRNASAMATEVSGGAYASLTVSLVTASAMPGQSAVYVSGDKLFKIGGYAIAAVGNALQGWVVEPGGKSFAHRVRESLLVHFTVGLIGLLVFVFVGPALSALLFGSVVAIDQFTALGFGVAALALSLNTALGRHVLLALGARKQIMFSVLGGAVVGVPMILLLSAWYGAPGGSWGLALSEAFVAIMQGIFALLRRKELGSWENAAGPAARLHAQ